MQGQGKRLLLAVSLALGVMLVWNMIFPSKPPDDQQQQGSGSGSGGKPIATVVAAKPKVCIAKPAGDGKPADVKPVGPESPDDVVTRDFPGKLTARFSTNGGTLIGWKLADPRYEKDYMRGELLPNKPDLGAFRIGFWGNQPNQRCLPEHQVWTFHKDKSNETTLVFTYAYDGMEFTKTFVIVPEAFMVRMALDMKVTVTGKEPLVQRLDVAAFAFQDPEYLKGGGSNGGRVAARIWGSSTLRDGEIVHTELTDLQDGPTAPSRPRCEGACGIGDVTQVNWTGFEHPYLLAAYALKRVDWNAEEPRELITKHTYSLEPYGTMRTDIELPQGIKFEPGTTTVTREVVAYLGPKNYYQLRDADDTAGFHTGFKETIDLGWFAFIGRPLMWLLFKFQSVVVNWGIAIMLLTFVVKALTLYWTTKSMRSMKQMAALAPQMKALQEKYKNDRQRIQAETMALYKQHNVNPIAGCLPILLQMPIWLALYRMLSNAGELYQQPFIPGWIDDLTDTDPYHILPIVLLITMFLQARLTPQSGDSRQQKFLQYGMPLMFGVMAFFFPAGLTLYIFTNTCLSALHSIYMNKYDKKTLAIVANMKRNAEAAAAKQVAETQKKEVKKVKKVIDLETTKAEDDNDDDAPASTEPKSSAPRPRPRNKKKKRR
jgi:YidC/Oxa1 family membrane protein insertase